VSKESKYKGDIFMVFDYAEHDLTGMMDAVKHKGGMSVPQVQGPSPCAVADVGSCNSSSSSSSSSSYSAGSSTSVAPIALRMSARNVQQHRVVNGGSAIRAVHSPVVLHPSPQLQCNAVGSFHHVTVSTSHGLMQQQALTV
jgi:hypothetical protein